MFHAERNVQALASAGARLSKALGIPYAPESFVLGVLCSDLDPAKHESLD